MRSSDDRRDMLLTLADVLALVRRQWKVMTFAFAAVMVAAATAYKLAPREYRADVVLVPIEDAASDLRASGSTGVSEVAALLGGSTASNWRQESLAFLRSRQIARATIQALSLLDELSPPSNQQPEPTTDDSRLSRAVMRFQKSVLRVAEDRTSGIVTVSAFAKEPARAAQIANGYVAVANRRARESALAELTADAEHLARELERTSSVEVRSVLLELVERNFKALSLAKARTNYAYRVIDPAVPGGRETAVRPRLTTYAAFGGVIALLIALIASLAVDARDRRRQRR
jgi:uncharacterized protein involved in exopolysaccharide biosynthesis